MVDACPENKRTLMSGIDCVTMIANSTPVIPGMTTSEIRRSGVIALAIRRAVSPSYAVMVMKPAWVRMIDRVSAMTFSSSTMRTTGGSLTGRTTRSSLATSLSGTTEKLNFGDMGDTSGLTLAHFLRYGLTLLYVLVEAGISLFRALRVLCSMFSY